MRAVLQRVSRAEVAVNGRQTGRIGPGLLILLGVGPEDTEKHADILADKIARLRIFTDENDKMNLSLLDVGGEALVVSQFTLYADCSHGRRPSFAGSAPPVLADRLYEYFKNALAGLGVGSVASGVFGAHMQVSLLNNGPVTITLDTKEWSKT